MEIVEQIGRFGCFGFMIFNIPGAVFGWWSQGAYVAYLAADSLLAVIYCGIWIRFVHSSSLFRALALSVLPSILFLFSGILSRSIPLTLAALLFAPSHILLSCKNACSGEP